MPTKRTVTDLEKARKKKRSKKSESEILHDALLPNQEIIDGGDKTSQKIPKLTAGEIEYMMAEWVDGIPLLDTRFPDLYFVCEVQPGRRSILRRVIEGSNVLRISSQGELADHLSRLSKDLWHVQFKVTIKKCEQVAKRWLADSERVIPWPKNVVFKSDTSFTFAQLPFDPAPNLSPLPMADFPVLAAALSRMTNPDAFCIRIGSLTDPEADRKQAIWMYGLGDGGKSFWQDVLCYLVGGKDAVSQASLKDLNNAHWMEDLHGKTLLVVRDTQAKFLQSGPFKSLLGDKYHTINPKYEKRITVKLNFFGFFTSNESPSFTNDSGIRNRVIPCRVQKIPEAEQLPEEEVWAKIMPEMPYFVAYCLKLYQANGRKRIPVLDDEDIEEAIAIYDSGEAGIFDRLFEISPDHVLPMAQFVDILDRLAGIKIRTKQYSAFRDYIKREFDDKVKFGKFGPKNERFKGIQGIALRRTYLPTPNS